VLNVKDKILIKDRNKVYTITRELGDLLTLVDADLNQKYYSKKNLIRSIEMGGQVVKIKN
jgi:hypothetical protein